jgi:t-SNARE complex subunit (syntaxin)
LDKLDANVAGIMAAVQSVQSRLDSLERNITDRVKDSIERQKEFQAAVQESIAAAARNQQIFVYVTWVLIAISIVLSVFL